MLLWRKKVSLEESDQPNHEIFVFRENKLSRMIYFQIIGGNKLSRDKSFCEYDFASFDLKLAFPSKSLALFFVIYLSRE